MTQVPVHSHGNQKVYDLGFFTTPFLQPIRQGWLVEPPFIYVLGESRTIGLDHVTQPSLTTFSWWVLVLDFWNVTNMANKDHFDMLVLWMYSWLKLSSAVDVTSVSRSSLIHFTFTLWKYQPKDKNGWACKGQFSLPSVPNLTQGSVNREWECVVTMHSGS